MKRLALFIVALVFAFSTTVMAAGDMTAPAAPPETTPLIQKAAPVKADKVKKAKKVKKCKKAKKEEKKDAAPADAPAAK